MSKRSKRHHFVPRVLQSAFVFEGDLLWYAEENSFGAFRSPELTPTSKAFVKSNYYSIVEDGHLSDKVERRFYGAVDNYLGNFLPEVFETFDRGQVPVFSGSPLELLKNVVYEMMKRTPDYIPDRSDAEFGEKYLDAIKEQAQKDGSSAEELQKLLGELESEENRLRIGRDIRVRSTIRKSERIDKAMEGLTNRWVRIEGKHSFILGSKLVYRLGNGGPDGLSNPKTEIWMPISPKVAVVLLRDPKNQIPLVCSPSVEKVRELNEHALRNSRQIASHSQRLIKSLTKSKSKYGSRSLRQGFNPPVATMG